MRSFGLVPIEAMAVVLLTIAANQRSYARRAASADSQGTMTVASTTRTYVLHILGSLKQGNAPLVLPQLFLVLA